MAGELWNAVVQIGKETTPGIGVAATRKMYFLNPKLTRTRAARPQQFSVGTRDNVRAFTHGPPEVGGSIEQSLSADETVELLLAAVQGGVTPTTPSGTAKLWTFRPSASVDSLTVEYNDGARAWQQVGVKLNTWKLLGDVANENKVTCDLFGINMQPQALTPGLSDRVPSFIEGWETRLYIDAIGGTPGTTVVPQSLIKWDVELNNHLMRKFFADNQNATGAVVVGELGLTSKFQIEAAAGQALTEYNNWDATTQRLIRLEFGQNTLIDSGTNDVQTITTTGTPTGGTFTLTFNGQTTAALPYNATASQIQAALQALPAIGYGGVACTGGPLPTGVVVTFQNQMGSALQSVFTHTDSLTGGSTPAVSIAHTTPGVNGTRKFFTIDLPGAWSVVDLGQDNNGTRVYEFTLQYVYDAVNAFGIQFRAQNARSTAY